MSADQAEDVQVNAEGGEEMEPAAEGQGDQYETEAPEGHEQAEEDMPAGDEAPEVEADWGDRVMQEQQQEEAEADGSFHGEEDHPAEEEHEDDAEAAEHPHDDEEPAADGDGAEGEGNGAADGAHGDEEYEVVDELEEDIDDGCIEEMEKEMRGDTDDAQDGEKKGDEKDEKKDSEKKPQKSRHPFFIPTPYEYKNELRKQMMNSTVLMGPVTFNDLSDEKLVGYIHKTQKVSVKFGKGTPSDDFKGYLELVFFTEPEAAECAKELEGHRDGFSVQHTSRDNRSPEISAIREHGDIFAGKSGDTTVVIPEIPSSVKEEDIAAQIPEAKQVFIPMSLHTDRKKRYAYVELADEETAKSVVGKEFTIDGEEYKVWRLETIPSYMSVLKQVSTLRYNQMMNQLPLDAGQRSQLFKISMSVTHYMRVDYLDRKALDDLKSAAEPLRRLLRVDAQRRTRGRVMGRPYRPAGGYRSASSSRGRPATSTYRPSDTRYGRGGSQRPTTSPRQNWTERRPSSTAPLRKRRYDEYEHGSYQQSSYGDKRPRSDYREDSYRGSRNYRDEYGSSYDEGYDDRHRGGHRDGSSSSYRDEGLADLDPRQAVDLLMGLTSMLKGRSGGRGDLRESPRRVSTRGVSSSPRGSSSYRGSSSNYRGSSSSYRGSSTTYRGSSSRGTSSYRGGSSSYRGARGSSSRGNYNSRYSSY